MAKCVAGDPEEVCKSYRELGFCMISEAFNHRGKRKINEGT